MDNEGLRSLDQFVHRFKTDTRGRGAVTEDERTGALGRPFLFLTDLRVGTVVLSRKSCTTNVIWLVT